MEKHLGAVEHGLPVVVVFETVEQVLQELDVLGIQRAVAGEVSECRIGKR